MPIAPIKKNSKFIDHLDFANQKIDDLNKVTWFTNVGKNNLKGVRRIGDWEEALQTSVDDAFGDYLQDLANDVRGFAAATSRDLYNKKWGNAHDAVSKPLCSFLESEVYTRIPAKKLSNYIKSGISGAFTNQLALALVYGIVHDKLDAHLKFFLDGYFPCDYEGEYPSGQLIVF